MRTTLDLDEDVLQAAKELAQIQGTTAGKVVSNLVRKALEPEPFQEMLNGVPLLPLRPGGRKVTLELVSRLRDEE